MKSYFRPEIDAMEGYVPGEQPKMADLCKLNTNENAYAPSPAVGEVLRTIDSALLRRYPDPMADALRDRMAELAKVERKNVIAGNGSDDILTMLFRCFTDAERPVACLDPTYSLYPVLAEMQSAPVIRIPLADRNFTLPENLLEQAKGANLLVIARPNAPSGNSFPLETMRAICKNFDGIVVFDEAYADFADDNTMPLAREFNNVIVSRTFSKSYSLAGLRLGYAVGHEKLIEGMLKVKDSYNIDLLTQRIGLAALNDEAYLAECCAKIKTTRKEFSAELANMGFHVIPSQTNFVFAAPPDNDGERCFKLLREKAIIVRYFKGPKTGSFVRITIGTPAEMKRVTDALRSIYR